jgi:hypothetical protein
MRGACVDQIGMKAAFQELACDREGPAIAIADFNYEKREHSGHFKILVAPTGLRRLGAVIGLSGSGSRWSSHLALWRIWT